MEPVFLKGGATIIKRLLILGILLLSCMVRGHPGADFNLKNSQIKYGFINNPNFEIKVSTGTYAYNFIAALIEINTLDTLAINLYNIKLIYKGQNIGYWCKYNRNSPEYSIVYTKKTNNEIYYSSTPTLHLEKGQEIKVFAKDFIFDGKEYYNIDTLTFIVE